jgi:hypothetical protein
MAGGGKRIGSGRKLGAATRKTREIADKAAAEGITPLEVHLSNMRYYFAEAEKAQANLNGITFESTKDLGEKERFELLKAAVKETFDLRQLADESANKASRFMHPPLAAVEPGKGADDHVPLAERIEFYERRDTVSAGAGKVVPLKKRKG